MRSCLGKQHITDVNKNIVTCQWSTLNKFVSVAGICLLGDLTFPFPFFSFFSFILFSIPSQGKGQGSFKPNEDIGFTLFFLFFSLSMLDPYPRFREPDQSR